MENKKIVFFDIDGTLINIPSGMNEISQETKRVIQEFKKAGHLVVIASARVTLPKNLKTLDIDGFIGSDGHYIIFNNQVILEDAFTQEQIELQMKLYKKHNAEYLFGGLQGSWVSDLDVPIVIYQRELYAGTKEKPEGVPEKWSSNEVKAISATPLFENKEDLYNCLNELPNDWSIEAYDTGLIRMDVRLPGFSKGTACQFLFKKLGIPFENTYAFGDGKNDIEMLTLVKHGIAMGNADVVVKNAASDITDSVENEGIAKAFKKYFNI
jgi:HAD-superfamily hydrolase, subfamily IIB